jgi:hypothetical protein
LPPGSNTIVNYALQQNLIPRKIDVAELLDGATARARGSQPSAPIAPSDRANLAFNLNEMIPWRRQRGGSRFRCRISGTAALLARV